MPKPKMPDLERRSLTFEVRAEERENGHILYGRPVVFNSRTNIGCFDEIIMPGALDKTDLTDVRFLVNHDTSMIPLARSRRNNGRSTMTLIPDADGLGFEAGIDIENNANARALYSATERGDITGMSFIFSVRGDDWDDLDTDHPTRRITDIASIIEISAVTFPAYHDTDIQARGQEALESAKAVLESARQKRAAEVETPDETRKTLDLLKAKLFIRR